MFSFVGFVSHVEVVVVISTMFVFCIFLSPENVHVMVIALTCWYAYCMDPAFPAIFCYISYYSPGFLVIAQVCSLMNCAEKRFCQPKAMSLFCRPVLFFCNFKFPDASTCI